MRFLRLAHAPGDGLVHLQDARRRGRTLCGRGVFLREGWRVAPLSIGVPISCRVCARIARKRYGV